MVYEWDPKKAKANLRKHRVSFEEAATVFLNPFAVTYPDSDHSEREIREITIGRSFQTQNSISLAHASRDRTRLISGRKATKQERKQYEESIVEEK